MGKKELFENKALGWAFRQVHGFPVDRGNMDMGAIRTAMGVLKAGETLGIFPEGTRSKSGHMPVSYTHLDVYKRQGCNIGCSVIVSQLFGAKKLGEMKTAVYTTFISSAVVCAALMLAGTLGCDGLLRLINTPENVFADSKLYLDIYILGLPFVFFYNVATGIFSALGDSKTPFIFLAASSTSNIFMDILFVTAFKMGVAGVAWATFLCQGVSCVLAVLFVLRRLRSVETDEKSALFSFPLFCRIAVIAVPSILQQSFISVGNIVIQGVICLLYTSQIN